MRKTINQVRIQGRVYQHKLEIKTVKNEQSANFGKQFIGGSMDIATDENGSNIVTVYYTYVTPTTKAGQENRTYTALANIINNDNTWIKVGKEAATKVAIDTSFAINDFVSSQNEELVAQVRCESGFVTIINELAAETDSKRNKFTVDMVITNVAEIPANPDTQTNAYASVRGYVFNFRNDLIPITFNARTEGSMNYFLNLGVLPSNPIFTEVWGRLVQQTIKIERVTESAFGEAAVDTIERKSKSYDITGAQNLLFDIGEAGQDMTFAELKTAMQNREIKIQEVKTQYEARKNAIPTTPTPAAASTVAIPGGFSF